MLKKSNRFIGIFGKGFLGWRPLTGTSSPKLPNFDNWSLYFLLLYGGGGAMVEKVDLQFSK